MRRNEIFMSRLSNVLYFSFLALSLFNSQLTFAHIAPPPVGSQSPYEIKMTVDPAFWSEIDSLYAGANIALSYRLLQPSIESEQWQMIGGLIGGEAYAPHDGLGVDEVFSVIGYNKKKYYAALHFGSHGAGHDPAIEQVMMGFRLSDSFRLEAGRMGADFTHDVAAHASQSLYVNRPLIYELMWGRQYVDDGLRFRGKSSWSSFDEGISVLSYGLELWQGRSFPSRCRKSTCFSYDSYLNYQYETGKVRLVGNVFYYRGYAALRTDDRNRLGASHSHAGASAPVSSDQIWYEGQVESHGMAIGIEGLDVFSFRLGMHVEYMVSRSKGLLGQDVRVVSYNNRYQGANSMAFVSGENWSVSARYERLQLGNYLRGDMAVSKQLAEKAFLQTKDDLQDPNRLGLSYRFMQDENLTLGLDYSREKGVYRPGYSSSFAVSTIFVMPVKMVGF
jgi:hypothetical protein